MQELIGLFDSIKLRSKHPSCLGRQGLKTPIPEPRNEERKNSPFESQLKSLKGLKAL